MLFNSIEFLIFFVVVYLLYLVLSHKWQNRMLLIASYVFYGFWDWRFLSLIFISTVVDYFCGIKIYNADTPGVKKKILLISVFVNLSLLGFFKYFNFFSSSLLDFFQVFGISLNVQSLNIILPVGISFYTFQTMSYAFDVYRGEIKPTKKFLDFALFVAFFPQLVAGPIERAKRLLPQMLKPRVLTISGFLEGCFLIFWGIFEKVFIASNLAKIVDPIFSNQSSYEGTEVLIGLYCFAFQIFCDFDAYSNIARGLGKCMGFELMVNFRLPYIATSPGDFWRRWHISFSSWLKDYLYIPLGGNRGAQFFIYRNLAITMLLGGLWHGASWTFIVWGAYHGALLMCYRLYPTNNILLQGKSIMHKEEVWSRESSQNKEYDRWFVLKVVVFFQFTLIGWLLFRSESLTQAGQMMHAIIFNFNVSTATYALFGKFLLIVSGLLAVQYGQYKKNDLLFLYHQHWLIQTVVYAFMTYFILGWGVMTAEEFIYFQF